MLKRDEILDGARAVVANIAGLPGPAAVTAATRLHHDLPESVCQARIWAGLEDRFSITFSLTELMVHGQRDGITVADLVDVVAGKLAQLQPAEVAA